MSVVTDWEVGEYVAVRSGDTWYPGKISLINEDNTIDITRMFCVDEPNVTNKFSWVGKRVKEDRTETCQRKDLFLNLDEPSEVSRGKRASYFKFKERDFDDAVGLFEQILN